MCHLPLSLGAKNHPFILYHCGISNTFRLCSFQFELKAQTDYISEGKRNLETFCVCLWVCLCCCVKQC